MKRKAIITALLLFLAAFGAFAEVGMYFKGALGYGYRTRDWGSWTYSTGTGEYAQSISVSTLPTFSYLFNIVPTFGIIPWQNSGNVFLDGLTFEFSLDLAFGKAITSASYLSSNFDSSSVVINPGAMAVFHYGVGPGRRIVPFGGVGVSVPIVIIGDLGDVEGVESSVKAGFNVNLLVGVGYAVTEKIMPLIEWGVGFGTGWSWQLRAGLTYKFGGGSGGGSARGSSGGQVVSSDTAQGEANGGEQQISSKDLPPAPENFSYFGTWRNATNPRETIIVYPDGLAVLQMEGEEPVVGSYRSNEARWGQRVRFSLPGMRNTDLLYRNDGVSTDGLYRYSGLTPPTGAPLYVR